MRFTTGTLLIIKPCDDDDPEALAHAGQRCRFLRYVESYCGREYAVVQFSTKGRPVVMRTEDLAIDGSEANCCDGLAQRLNFVDCADAFTVRWSELRFEFRDPKLF